MTTVAEITTDEALAVYVAVAQAKQAAMNPFERRRAERIEATRPGRRRWAQQITRTVDDETDDLVERHGRQILADAEALLRQADPVALAGQPLHLIDFDTIGTRSMTVGGFTMAGGVYDVLRPILPADAAPGPTIALNVRAELADATANLPAATSEANIVSTAAWWIGGTAIHEYAHTVTEQAAGRQIECPVVLGHPDRVEAIARALDETQSAAGQAHAHPLEWTRAYYHLAHRAGTVERFVADVGRYYANPEAIAAGLRLEALIVDHREPVVEIIRRHPPALFVAAATPLTFREDSPCRQ
jgi:hypothetical protein